MVNNQVDVIIFGATGFTGKFVALECAKLNSFSWAVAGRNKSKLRTLLDNISTQTGMDLNDVAIIEAECSDVDSMTKMAQMGKVVINCSGPFRFFGESVVKACAENGTNYVDITGEPEFMEKMVLLYSDTARKNGCYIVNSCGMDSIPVDLGVVHFSKHFDGQVNYIETYMKQSTSSDKYEPFANSTTWESAVHGFANIQSLIDVRKKLYSKIKRVKTLPAIPKRSSVHKSEVYNQNYSVPFPGSDKSVTVRSQSALYMEYGQRPIQIEAYLVCENIVILAAILLIGFFLNTFTKYNWGKELLLKYPGVFTLGIMTEKGPSQEYCAKMTAVWRLHGTGWCSETTSKSDSLLHITDPMDSKMITEISITDPGYGFTSMCAVQCALLFLQELEKFPKEGGVYTPGFAFYNTTLLDRLAKNGVEFKILKKNKL